MAPAPWFSRAGALILDGLVMLAAGVLVGLIAFLIVGDASSINTVVAADGTVTTDEFPHALLAGVIGFFAAAFLYPWVALGAMNGQTIGRRAAGVRVVTYDGRPIGYGRAFLREVVVKSALGIFTIPLLVSYLMPLGERHQRALHDLVVSTRAVDADATAPAPGLSASQSEFSGFAAPVAAPAEGAAPAHPAAQPSAWAPPAPASRHADAAKDMGLDG